jgi:hypothetical protein
MGAAPLFLFFYCRINRSERSYDVLYVRVHNDLGSVNARSNRRALLNAARSRSDIVLCARGRGAKCPHSRNKNRLKSRRPCGTTLKFTRIRSDRQTDDVICLSCDMGSALNAGVAARQLWYIDNYVTVTDATNGRSLASATKGGSTVLASRCWLLMAAAVTVWRHRRPGKKTSPPPVQGTEFLLRCCFSPHAPIASRRLSPAPASLINLAGAGKSLPVLEHPVRSAGRFFVFPHHPDPCV